MNTKKKIKGKDGSVSACEIAREKRGGEERKERERGIRTNVNEILSTLLGAERLDDFDGWSTEGVEVGGVDEVGRRVLERERSFDGDVPDAREENAKRERQVVSFRTEVQGRLKHICQSHRS